MGLTSMLAMNSSSKVNICDPVGVVFTGPEAYLSYTESSDVTLQAWYFVIDFENKRFDKAFISLGYFEGNSDVRKVIFCLLISWLGNKLNS